jgi:DNA-binding CsgD family transcriptional regulator
MRPQYVADGAPSSYFIERFGLSGREREVVSGVLSGQGNNEIAWRLFISPRTVEKHLSNVYQTAGIKSRLQLFNPLRSDQLWHAGVTTERWMPHPRTGLARQPVGRVRPGEGWALTHADRRAPRLDGTRITRYNPSEYQSRRAWRVGP